MDHWPDGAGGGVEICCAEAATVVTERTRAMVFMAGAWIAGNASERKAEVDISFAKEVTKRESKCGSSN